MIPVHLMGHIVDRAGLRHFVSACGTYAGQAVEEVPRGGGANPLLLRRLTRREATVTCRHCAKRIRAGETDPEIWQKGDTTHKSCSGREGEDE